MANTSQLNLVKEYVIDEMGKRLKTELEPRKVPIGIGSNGQLNCTPKNGHGRFQNSIV